MGSLQYVLLFKLLAGPMYMYALLCMTVNPSQFFASMSTVKHPCTYPFACSTVYHECSGPDLHGLGDGFLNDGKSMCIDAT